MFYRVHYFRRINSASAIVLLFTKKVVTDTATDLSIEVELETQNCKLYEQTTDNPQFHESESQNSHNFDIPTASILGCSR